MATPKVASLPDAVAAHCFSFLDSVGHSACAQVCQWFRRLALLPGGFPDVVRVDMRHVGAASPALLQMQPRRLLETHIAEAPDRGGLRRLLKSQTRVRRLRITSDAPPLGNPRDPLWRSCCSDTYPYDTNDESDQVLAACTCFQVHARSLMWSEWFGSLLARMPDLVRLELRQFPEYDIDLVLVGAPHLVALRIDDNERTRHNHARPAAADDRNFVAHVLINLAALRHLALPYATVPRRELLCAADRLESLQVRVISDPSDPIPAGSLTVRPVHMTKLRRVVADVAEQDAARIFAHMSAVCSGRVGFRSRDHDDVDRNGHEVGGRLVALISECVGGDGNGNGNGDGNGGGAESDGGDADRKVNGSESGGSYGGDGGGGVHVAWQIQGCASFGLAIYAGRALSELGSRWRSQSLDGRMDSAVRTTLGNALTRARSRKSEPVCVQTATATTSAADASV